MYSAMSDYHRTYMECWYGVLPTDYSVRPGDLARYDGKTEPDMIGSLYDETKTEAMYACRESSMPITVI